MPTQYVSTWMYVESADEAGLYPQVGGQTTRPDVQNIYWRCVFTFFWSASTFIEKKDDLKLVLFTNVSKLPVVDGLDLNVALADYGVEIVTLRYTWAPSGNQRFWFNQYYLFDILHYYRTRLEDEDALLIMDNDCLIVRDLAPAFDRLRHDGVLLLTVDVGEDEDANGLSRREAMRVYESIAGARPDQVPPYFGGEFYGLTAKILRPVVDLADEVRAKNNALASAGCKYFSDEAHFFSYLMGTLGYRKPNANTIARRIWTTWKLNNTHSADLDLLVWHLPSEKTYGFADLFADLVRNRAPAGNLSALRSRLARRMGVGHKSTRKFLGHFSRAMRRRL